MGHYKTRVVLINMSVLLDLLRLLSKRWRPASVFEILFLNNLNAGHDPRNLFFFFFLQAAKVQFTALLL